MFDDRKKVRSLIAATILGAMAAALAGSVTGCNTTEGLGKDIEEGGDAIKDKAREEKND